MWPKIVTQHRMENLKEKCPYHDPSYRIQCFSNVQIAPVYFLFLHQKVENLWLSYFCIINAWKFDPLPLCIYTHPFFIKIYSTPSYLAPPPTPPPFIWSSTVFCCINRIFRNKNIDGKGSGEGCLEFFYLCSKNRYKMVKNARKMGNIVNKSGK